MEEGDKSFSEAASDAKNKAIELFTSVSKGSLVDSYDWSFQGQLDELQANLSKAIKTRRSEEIKALIQRLQKTTKNKITDVVLVNFDGGKGDNNLWKDLFVGYVKMFQGVEKTFEKKLKGTYDTTI